MLQTRIQISLYDSIGNGYLIKNDLKLFLEELIHTFPSLKEIPKDIYDNYFDIAMKKFEFFLDPSKTGKIFIKNILVSPILAELFEL